MSNAAALLLKCRKCEGPYRPGQNPVTSGLCEECEKPAWVKEFYGKVWIEDDALPIGGETLRNAWKRIYGESLILNMRLSEYDGGDADYYLMSAGRIAIISYPGQNEIRQLTVCECGDSEWHQHSQDGKKIFPG